MIVNQQKIQSYTKFECILLLVLINSVILYTICRFIVLKKIDNKY